jgi:ABC-type cobalamin/Fe3+-siderophores transport system ATPase subunit
MTVTYQIPRIDDTPLSVDVEQGKVLFIVGANGTGKSKLIYLLRHQSPRNSRLIMAVRPIEIDQNVTQSQSYKALSNQSDHYDNMFLNGHNFRAWYNTHTVAAMTVKSLRDLLNSEQTYNNDGIIEARNNQGDASEYLKRNESPLLKANRILKNASFRFELAIHPSEEFLFEIKKNTGEVYTFLDLSDGEKNAIQLMAEVLTAPTECLILIDEPEKHLHRSISAPLLKSLFEERSDCTFIVATHDLQLPIECLDSQVLILREYYANPQSWRCDLVEESRGYTVSFLR